MPLASTGLVVRPIRPCHTQTRISTQDNTGHPHSEAALYSLIIHQIWRLLALVNKPRGCCVTDVLLYIHKDINMLIKH